MVDAWRLLTEYCIIATCSAGVLRGDRARFQLFGDTVNTASRMESTGLPDRIQISGSTAALLRESGKEHWLKERDGVYAKGKGVVKTYWANPKTSQGSNSGTSETDTQSEVSSSRATPSFNVVRKSKNNTNQRLVDWMADLLLDHAKKVIHSRRHNSVVESTSAPVYHPEDGKTCMDEVKTVIEMPAFDKKSVDTRNGHINVQISSKAVTELREYVAQIAARYHANPFHNFEHAW